MPENNDLVQTEAKKDLLRTNPVEAQELQVLIEKGLKAHNTVGFLTFLGIIIMVFAGLYYSRLDGTVERYLQKKEIATNYSTYLNKMVENQYNLDREMYGAKKNGKYPEWPVRMYYKLRKDIYIVGTAVLLIALIFLFVERAKLTRNDLLVYRAMAREIEKLRLRVKRIEGEQKSNNSTEEDKGSDNNS